MMLKKNTFFLLLIFCSIWAYSDGVKDPKPKRFLNPESYQLNIFNNQYYFPFTGFGAVFNAKYHPGISVGLIKNIKKTEKKVFYYDLKLGVYNHRFIQTGIQLYGDIGYRIKLPKQFFMAGEFGLGYLHAIIHQSKFESDQNGSYTKVKNFGKPQMMTGIGIKLGKELNLKNNSGRLFINYQPWFQFPFIKSYVPLLPNNSLHIGFDLILK